MRPSQATAGATEVPRTETGSGRHFSMFAALRHREYRLLWIGLVVSNVGSWMQMVALGWLVYSLTDSPFWLGLVGFSRAIPVFVFTLWGGVLADRADRRRVMLVADSFIALFAVALGLLAASGQANVWLVLVLAFVTAAAWSFEVPSRQSLVPDLVPRQDMVSAIGLQSAAFNGAGVIGPTVAALLIESVGIAGAFLLNGLLTLAVVAALLMMKPVKRSGVGGGSALANLFEGFRYVRRTVFIGALFLIMAVTNLIARPFIQLMPVFARDILQVGASGLGVMMGLMGAGGLLGAIAVASSGGSRHRGRALVVSGVLFCLLLVGFALSPWYALSVLLCFLLGFFQNFFFASTNTTIQTNVPNALRGRVMSIHAFIMMGFMPLGSMILGAVSELLGVQLTVAIGGLLSLLVIAITVARVPRLREME